MLTVCSEGNWPFSFVAQVTGEHFSYKPRSDFLMLLEGYPFLFIEICSDRLDELDRYRMLLQAGILVRVMNSFKSHRGGEFKSFIAVVIYVNSKFTAERYLVCQPQPGTQSTIAYLKDEFNLKTPIDAFRFFFELHNLSSALPRDDQLSGAASGLGGLAQQVREASIPHFIPNPTRNRRTGDVRSNTPPEEDTFSGGDSSLTRALSNLGIRLDSKEEFPGWTTLNPVRSLTFVG